MNTQDAIAEATINGITVGTDHTSNVQQGRVWTRVIRFRVGPYTVARESDWKDWLIVGVSPKRVKRGEAIAECVRMILESRQQR